MNNNLSNKCDICYDSDYDKLIYESKLTLSRLSNEIVKSLTKGYSCDKNAVDKSKYLDRLLSVLEDQNRKNSLGGFCLNSFQKQALAEKVRKLTTQCNLTLRKDLVIDSSNEQKWITDNPYCVSREKWEKFAFQVCGAFNLEINILKDTADCDITINPKVLSVEEACNLTFEITRNIIPCDIIMAISVYEEVCDLDLKVTRTLEQCDIDFEILVTENKCDIELDLYKRLIECNLSFDIIQTIYNNGCTLEIEGDDVVLVSSLSKHPINTLNFKGTINPENIKKLNIDNKNSQYLKNPKQFIEKLKSDYGK